MTEQQQRQFFDDETPETTLVLVGKQELRFYPKAGRLTVSRKSWTGADGTTVLGKAVNLKLKENVGNREFINLLERVVEYLKGR